MKNIFSCLCILLLATCVRAQDTSHATTDSLGSLIPAIDEGNHPPSLSKIYFKVTAGYGLFTPGSYKVQSTNLLSYFDNSVPPMVRDTSIQSEGNKGIGSGWRTGGGFGYVLNDFLNIGIDFEFQKGKKLTNSLVTRLDANHYDSTTDHITYQAFTLSPYITFKALAKPKYYIYNKLGILFTFPFTMKTSGQRVGIRGEHWPVGPTDSALSNFTRDESSYNGTYKISLGIGFNAALGINFNLGHRVRYFAELFGNFTALKPKNSRVETVRKYQFNNFEPIYDYNVDPPAFVYYKPSGSQFIVNTGENTNYHKNSPRVIRLVSTEDIPGDIPIINSEYAVDDKRFTMNLNAIGINFGVIYRF